VYAKPPFLITGQQTNCRVCDEEHVHVNDIQICADCHEDSSTTSYRTLNLCKDCTARYQTLCSKCFQPTDIYQDGTICPSCYFSTTFIENNSRGVCLSCGNVGYGINSEGICITCYSRGLLKEDSAVCTSCKKITTTKAFTSNGGVCNSCASKQNRCQNCGSKVNSRFDSFCASCKKTIKDGKCLECKQKTKVLDNEGKCEKCIKEKKSKERR
jgi:hypothetical protein